MLLVGYQQNPFVRKVHTVQVCLLEILHLILLVRIVVADLQSY